MNILQIRARSLEAENENVVFSELLIWTLKSCLDWKVFLTEKFFDTCPADRLAIVYSSFKVCLALCFTTQLLFICASLTCPPKATDEFSLLAGLSLPQIICVINYFSQSSQSSKFQRVSLIDITAFKSRLFNIRFVLFAIGTMTIRLFSLKAFQPKSILCLSTNNKFKGCTNQH